MNLFFEDSRGQRRHIAAINDDLGIEDATTQVFREIHKFCRDRHFHIHYTRVWNESPGSKVDVGSHTEFFSTDKPLL